MLLCIDEFLISHSLTQTGHLPITDIVSSFINMMSAMETADIFINTVIWGGPMTVKTDKSF